MTRRWLAATLMAMVIPIVAIVAVGALTGIVEGEWRAALVAEFGEIPPESEARVTLGALCSDPEFTRDVPGVCNDTTVLGLLRGAAIASGVVALVVLAVAGGTALVTRGSRRRMALLFRPALVVVLAGTALLLVLQAIVLIGLTWEAMTVWVGYIWPWLLVILGFAALAAVAGVLKAIAAMLQPQPVTVHGLVLSRDDHPLLYEEVDDIATLLGTQPPDRIAGGLEPNFFVVDTTVHTFDGEHAGRTLFVSAPLSAVLTLDEFRAVIGHELGHFRGEDTAFTRRISPLYAAGRESLGSLTSSRHWSSLVSLPAATLLDAVFGTLVSSVSAVSRERELQADRAGAEAASAAALAMALRKLHATSSVWGETLVAALRAASAGVPIRDVAAVYLERARRAAATTGVDEARIPHPFDTHPGLADRLTALGLDTAPGVALDLAPADAATILLGDAAALNARLSELLAPAIQRAIAHYPLTIATGPTHAIREAAQDDIGIAAVATLAIDRRGPELERQGSPDGRWIVLTDLLLAPCSDAVRHGFDWAVRPSKLPASEPLLISDAALAGDPVGLVLRKGTELLQVGRSNAENLDLGVDEDAFIGLTGEPPTERIVVRRNVGSGGVREQVSSLLVVPAGDILNAAAGPIAREVVESARLLASTRTA